MAVAVLACYTTSLSLISPLRHLRAISAQFSAVCGTMAEGLGIAAEGFFLLKR